MFFLRSAGAGDGELCVRDRQGVRCRQLCWKGIGRPAACAVVVQLRQEIDPRLIE
jgi:hypothetical protein